MLNLSESYFEKRYKKYMYFLIFLYGSIIEIMILSVIVMVYINYIQCILKCSSKNLLVSNYRFIGAFYLTI